MGLPYIDSKKPQDVSFVKNAKENSEGFTNKDIATDKIYHKYQGMIGRPSERDFKSMVVNNLIQECPITDSDTTNSHTMFVPNLDGTRGKTVQQNVDRMVMD